VLLRGVRRRLEVKSGLTARRKHGASLMERLELIARWKLAESLVPRPVARLRLAIK